jgi:hypothetical protein
MPTSTPEVEKLRKRPLSDVALETLAAMVDEDLILITSNHGSLEPRFFAMRTLEILWDRRHPLVVDQKTLDALFKRKYIFRVGGDKFAERLAVIAKSIGKEPPNGIGFYDFPNAISPDGRAAVEMERDRLVDIRASRELEPDDRPTLPRDPTD